MALSVPRQVRLGAVHGMKSCMIEKERGKKWPFMAASYGQNDVFSNSRS